MIIITASTDKPTMYLATCQLCDWRSGYWLQRHRALEQAARHADSSAHPYAEEGIQQ